MALFSASCYGDVIVIYLKKASNEQGVACSDTSVFITWEFSLFLARRVVFVQDLMQFLQTIVFL